MFAAAPGEKCLYHIGQMLVDQEKRPDLKRLGDYAVLMSDFGAVAIAQRRMGEGVSQYIAARTDRPTRGIPKNVGLGNVSVDLYRVLNAIHNREKRVAVRKSIRNALICSEADASDILDALIVYGIVDPGIPPAGPSLTKAGIEYLK